MFLLVPAYPGCPGSKAVKRSLLLLLFVGLLLTIFKHFGLTSSCVHWACSSSSSSVQHYCLFVIYFLLCMSSLSICAILLTVFDFSTDVANKHLILRCVKIGKVAERFCFEFKRFAHHSACSRIISSSSSSRMAGSVQRFDGISQSAAKHAEDRRIDGRTDRRTRQMLVVRVY